MTVRRVFLGAAIVTIASAIVVAQHAPAPSGEWISLRRRRPEYEILLSLRDRCSEREGACVAWRWKSPTTRSPGLCRGVTSTCSRERRSRSTATSSSRRASTSGQHRWPDGEDTLGLRPRFYRRGTPQRMGFVHRGIASGTGRRVFLASGDGYLTALDVDTGTPVGGFGGRDTSTSSTACADRPRDPNSV